MPVGDDDFQMEMEPDDEEFEVAIDVEPDHLDIIPLDDEPTQTQPTKAASPAASGQDQKQKAKGPVEPAAPAEPAAKSQSPEEEDVVAQFLMDLKLDEDE